MRINDGGGTGTHRATGIGGKPQRARGSSARSNSAPTIPDSMRGHKLLTPQNSTAVERMAAEIRHKAARDKANFARALRS